MSTSLIAACHLYRPYHAGRRSASKFMTMLLWCTRGGTTAARAVEKGRHDACLLRRGPGSGRQLQPMTVSTARRLRSWRSAWAGPVAAASQSSPGWRLAGSACSPPPPAGSVDSQQRTARPAMSRTMYNSIPNQQCLCHCCLGTYAWLGYLRMAICTASFQRVNSLMIDRGGHLKLPPDVIC